jgi:hypothetical protein
MVLQATSSQPLDSPTAVQNSRLASQWKNMARRDGHVFQISFWIGQLSNRHVPLGVSLKQFMILEGGEHVVLMNYKGVNGYIFY